MDPMGYDKLSRHIPSILAPHNTAAVAPLILWSKPGAFGVRKTEGSKVGWFNYAEGIFGKPVFRVGSFTLMYMCINII